MRTASVKGSETTTNKKSNGNKLILQLEISSADDIQSVQLMQSAGENSPPPEDSRVIVIPISQAYKLAVGVDDGIEPPECDPGEKILYSSDSGTIKAKMYFDASGNITLNDGTDTAVAFSRLKTAFDTLKADYNTLVTAYNAHVHPFTGVGPGNPGTTVVTASTGTPSTADMSSAESETVAIP